MYESFFASVLFWIVFGYSAGPFWIAVMQASIHTPVFHLLKEYLIYFFTGWLSLIVTIGIVVTIIGQINEFFLSWMYFIGAAAMFYFAWKIITATGTSTEKITFNWKIMTAISWVNPKVWLTIPSGFLTANFTGSSWLNIILFYLLGVPIFISAFFFWAKLGQQSAKLMKEKINYFNAMLMSGFAIYLLYNGLEKFI